MLRKTFFALLIGFFFSPIAFASLYCGDGILSEGETCDDGNFINRDGCDSYCKLEDMEAPTVASVSIPNGTTGISTLTKSFSVTFSEPIDESSIILNFTLRFEHAAKPMDFDFRLESDQKTITILINQELFSDDSHALRLRGIRDVAGNTMAGDSNDNEDISVFHTAVAIDYTAPTLVANPPGGAYTFAQNVELKAYDGDYTGSDDFLDETATIYYTLNDVNISESSPVYTEPFSVREGTTVRSFAVDGVGNKTTIHTDRYSLVCPTFENAKEVVNRYPECAVLSCDYGFVLRGNYCVVRLGGEDPDDYKANAVTAPTLPSDTPMTITSKPAIYITREHNGTIARPLIFKDVIRGTVIEFDKGTKITTEEGKPFTGYIKPPNNLYMKDFPIEFGYSFRSIFEFASAEGESLQFDPPYKITIPFTDAFNPNEKVTVLSYIPENEDYIEYPRGLYETDLNAKTVTVSAYKTKSFFIAQSGKNYNASVFQDVLTHWAKNYIEALYRKGIVKGRSKGVFAPNDYLTRAEFLKIALKAVDAEVDNADDIEDTPFSDVPLYAWYTPYANKAHELGLVKGYSDGTFRPDQFINRAEAVKILFSAFEFDMSGRPVSDSIQNKKRYLDLKGSQWYFPYADFAIQKGIMSGIADGNDSRFSYFGPAKSITRAEMAKLAIKTIELAESEDK